MMSDLVCPNKDCKGFIPPSRTTVFRTVFKKRGWIMRNLDRIRKRDLKGVEHKLKPEVVVSKTTRKKPGKKRPRYRFRTVVKGSKYACRTCGAIAEVAP